MKRRVSTRRPKHRLKWAKPDKSNRRQCKEFDLRIPITLSGMSRLSQSPGSPLNQPRDADGFCILERKGV